MDRKSVYPSSLLCDLSSLNISKFVLILVIARSHWVEQAVSRLLRSHVEVQLALPRVLSLVLELGSLRVDSAL